MIATGEQVRNGHFSRLPMRPLYSCLSVHTLHVAGHLWRYSTIVVLYTFDCPYKVRLAHRRAMTTLSAPDREYILFKEAFIRFFLLDICFIFFLDIAGVRSILILNDFLSREEDEQERSSKKKKSGSNGSSTFQRCRAK
jgi:hypothetical protein